ncbi:hypothetical protein V500_10430, partial [Pseudogymnoascus sp. VKM F-4518 (FW-2643)]
AFRTRLLGCAVQSGGPGDGAHHHVATRAACPAWTRCGRGGGEDAEGEEAEGVVGAEEGEAHAGADGGAGGECGVGEEAVVYDV